VELLAGPACAAVARIPLRHRHGQRPCCPHLRDPVNVEIGGTVEDWPNSRKCDFAQTFWTNVLQKTGECCCNYKGQDRYGVPAQLIMYDVDADGVETQVGPDCKVGQDDALEMCFAVNVNPGSVVVQNVFIYLDPAAANAEQATVQAAIGDSTASAQALFNDLGVTILRAPVVLVVETLTIKNVDAFGAVAASITVTLGMLFVLAMIGLYYYMKKGRKKPVYPA